MNLNSIKFILTFLICSAISFVADGQIANKISVDNNILPVANNLNYDTSKTAIIAFKKNRRWPFDSTFKSTFVIQFELQLIDSLLLITVTRYNNSLYKDHKQWSIDLKKRNYRNQLIVVTNKDGQKEFW